MRDFSLWECECAGEWILASHRRSSVVSSASRKNLWRPRRVISVGRVLSPLLEFPWPLILLLFLALPRRSLPRWEPLQFGRLVLVRLIRFPWALPTLVRFHRRLSHPLYQFKIRLVLGLPTRLCRPILILTMV
jgi:hypothetical protein